MVFKLDVASDEDMLRSFEILSLAFGHEHPYIEAAYPHHETPQGRAIGGSRLLAIKNSDPNTTFLKVTDTETNVIVAMAKWNIYQDNTIPDEWELEGDFWANEEEKEYAQVLCREYLIPRRKAIRESGGNVVCECQSNDSTARNTKLTLQIALDLLVVDPKYQRRGAGRMLVKWGTENANRLGVKTLVEATTYGRGLYEQEGFEFVENWETKLPAKWVGKREPQRYIWLVRPVGEARTEES